MAARSRWNSPQLRTINVENLSNREGAAVDVRKVDLRSMLDSRTGAGHKTGTEKKLRNIGPSIGYKLRDSAGQAREYPKLHAAHRYGRRRQLCLSVGRA